MKIHVLDHNCSGPNPHCALAASRGRYAHVIALTEIYEEPSLVMPSYHFQTIEDGIEAVRHAWATAPVITSDEELYAARRDKIPHKLPVGWIDPSRR